MKNLQQSLKNKVNQFKIKDFFEEFLKSSLYDILLDVIKNHLDMIEAQLIGSMFDL